MAQRGDAVKFQSKAPMVWGLFNLFDYLSTFIFHSVLNVTIVCTQAIVVITTTVN
jgi:hypothetical protein